MKYTLGFIGCGNMGGALVQAAAKTIGGTNIAICDHHEEKTATLQKAYGVTVTSAREIAQNSRFVILGVKPQKMQEAVAEVADVLQARDDVIIVTMAASLSIAAMRSFCGYNVPVIRIMPNTPVTLGMGMILYTTLDVDAETENDFLTAFARAGTFDKIPEENMDAASALSGCGPAFVYAFAKALTQGAVACGVPADKAGIYTAQTLKGAAEMLLQFHDPDALIKAVCSPGGTTIAGIKALENADFQNVASVCVTAAYQRALELKK